MLLSPCLAHTRVCVAVLLTTALVQPSPAFPQPSADAESETDVAETEPSAAQGGDRARVEEIRILGEFAPEDSYRLRNASSVTKTETPIFEIPSSVQVVPREVIRQQTAITLSDTYRNVSGVFEGDRFTSQRNSERPFIRGFQSRSVYRNGFPLREVGPQDIAAIDRVEIVKGPSSVLYGLMEPGGVVNMVMKRPSADREYSIDQQFGSHSWYRTTLNATGPVVPDETLMYRFDFSYTTSNSFRDFVDQERVFVAPSLLWEPTPDTSLLIESSFAFQENRYDSGLAFGPEGKPVAPIRTFLGEPSLPRNDSRDIFAGAYLTHDANDWLTLRGALTMIDYDLKFRQLIPSTPTLPDFTVDEWNYDLSPTRTSYGLVLDSISRVSFWNSDHVILAGVDLQRERFHNRFDIGIAPRINRSILDPQYGPLPPPDFTIGGNVVANVSWLGVYAQDQISLLDSGALKLLLAVRYDYVDQKTRDLESSEPNVTSSVDAFTYRAGLLYEVLEELAVYASVAESFLPPPNGTMTLDGDSLGPEKGFQVEVGTKVRLLDDHFRATAALYQLEKSDVSVADPRNPLFSLNGGKQRSRGFEIDFIGEVTDEWNVIGGYALTDTEVLDSDILPEGEPFRNVPRNSGSVWLWYDPPPWGDIGDFGVGVGVQAVEARLGDDRNTFRLPGYARLDLALSYQRPVYDGLLMRAQLNATNLTDQEFYTASALSSTVEPGYPLRFIGTIGVDF